MQMIFLNYLKNVIKTVICIMDKTNSLWESPICILNRAVHTSTWYSRCYSIINYFVRSYPHSLNPIERVLQQSDNEFSTLK